MGPKKLVKIRQFDFFIYKIRLIDLCIALSAWSSIVTPLTRVHTYTAKNNTHPQ